MIQIEKSDKKFPDKSLPQLMGNFLFRLSIITNNLLVIVNYYLPKSAWWPV